MEKLGFIAFFKVWEKCSLLQSNMFAYDFMVCLFVLGSHSRNFHLNMETSPLPVKCESFYLYSALIAIEKWGFFSVPHLLWLGASVYNGHLRGSVTLTLYCRAFCSGAVTTWLFFFYLSLSWLGFEHPTFRMRGSDLTHFAYAAVKMNKDIQLLQVLYQLEPTWIYPIHINSFERLVLVIQWMYI